VLKQLVGLNIVNWLSYVILIVAVRFLEKQCRCPRRIVCAAYTRSLCDS